jgi:hypothetical protein
MVLAGSDARVKLLFCRQRWIASRYIESNSIDSFTCYSGIRLYRPVGRRIAIRVWVVLNTVPNVSRHLKENWVFIHVLKLKGLKSHILIHAALRLVCRASSNLDHDHRFRALGEAKRVLQRDKSRQ